jgi:hypothetical protein
MMILIAGRYQSSRQRDLPGIQQAAGTDVGDQVAVEADDDPDCQHAGGTFTDRPRSPS